MTKVVIRRLPPSMTQDQFIEQVSPLPEHDYLHFVKADMSLGQHAFCRSYINFTDQKDIFMFREKFDNYVFVDGKGTEYPAVVEFAPFQRLPKKRIGRKKDVKCGTIETDPYYVAFLDSLKNLEADAAGTQPKTEFSFQPFDNAQKKVTTTPLLEYLKQRKMEKQRVRDEKREERRRRDLERRRAKDEPTISKVLKNPDAEREVGRENKENKEEKEKPQRESKGRKKDDKLRDKVLGPRDREGKMGKGYKDDRKQERDGKHQKKHEDKKSYRREENHPKEDKKVDGKSQKELKDDFREQRERRTEEKKGKSYEKMRQEKRRLAESKKQVEGSAENVKEVGKRDEGERRKKEGKFERATTPPESGGGDGGGKIESKERTPKNAVTNSTDTECRGEGDTVKSPEPIQIDKDPRGFDMDDSDTSAVKKTLKLSRRRSSLESGGDAGGGDGAQLRRHKSLDGDNQSNLQKNSHDEKHKDKKDSRKERRIRNKDRPAMEIYRPGMGRFSKQRIDRGKSNTEERATLSESPTNTSSDQKSELRSMTFKRSVSRDNP
uniref:UPF3A protein n=1 Tax=Fopius arisanus TaxID=64838 RepID=A0A0C9PZX1_9HYME